MKSKVPFFIKHSNEKKLFGMPGTHLKFYFFWSIKNYKPQNSNEIKCITVDEKICNCSWKFCKKEMDKKIAEIFQEIYIIFSEFV